MTDADLARLMDTPLAESILVERAKRVFHRRLRQWSFYRHDWREEERALCLFALWRSAWDCEALGASRYVEGHLRSLPQRVRDDLSLRLLCINADRAQRRAS